MDCGGIGVILPLVLALASSGGLRWTGADVTFIPQVERNSGVYRRGTKVIDPLVAMRESGQNLARIRIWNDPADGDCGIEQVTALAVRCHRAGLKVLLDFHYSDTWADPGHQVTPKAWKDLDADGLATAVYDFTAACMRRVMAAGVTPAMVQVGNEITGGMLWPLGRYNKLDNLARFLRSGLRAVKEVSPTTLTMVHIDRGGDVKSATWFYGEMAKRKVEYDLIGLSYYPWWQGTFGALSANLEALSSRFRKDVIVVETAYPWTDKPSGKERVFNDLKKLPKEFAPTPAGQAAFLRKLGGVVSATPGGRGVGLVYWAPDWLDLKKAPSPWDNLNWFDLEGRLLPAHDAMGKLRK